jgi:hypothetical protein
VCSAARIWSRPHSRSASGPRSPDLWLQTTGPVLPAVIRCSQERAGLTAQGGRCAPGLLYFIARQLAGRDIRLVTQLVLGLEHFPVLLTTLPFPAPTLAFATIRGACIQAGTASTPGSIPVESSVFSAAAFGFVAIYQFSVCHSIGSSAAFTTTTQILVAIDRSMPRIVGVLKPPFTLRLHLAL